MISPRNGRTSADYISDNGVNYVTTPTTGTDSTLVAVMPPQIALKMIYEFRFSAKRGANSWFTADIKIEYTDCRNAVISPPSGASTIV